MPLIKLDSVICNVPDQTRKDEIFIKYQDKKIWPAKSKFIKIGVDDKKEIGIKGNFKEGWIEIELWDFGYTLKHRLLGTFHLEVGTEKGEFGSMLSVPDPINDQADYTLNWKIMNQAEKADSNSL